MSKIAGMTVKQLIEKLQAHDPSHVVVMSKDAEGNSASPLCDVDISGYEPESTYHGYFADKDEGETNVVSLWPIN